MFVVFRGGGGVFGDEGVEFGAFFVGGDAEDGAWVGDVAVPGFFGAVVEEGGDGVEVLLGDGVEFVVVAGGAADGEAEEGGAEGFGAVAGVVGVDFLGDGSAFVGGDVAADVAGGDPFVGGFCGDEVAGDLFADELVVGFVGGEGADDVVAVGPDGADVVEVEAVGVGVA
jgi:hypothetical protein